MAIAIVVVVVVIVDFPRGRALIQEADEEFVRGEVLDRAMKSADRHGAGFDDDQSCGSVALNHLGVRGGQDRWRVDVYPVESALELGLGAYERYEHIEWSPGADVTANPDASRERHQQFCEVRRRGDGGHPTAIFDAELPGQLGT